MNRSIFSRKKPVWAINLRTARKNAGLTQQQVACKIFKSRETYGTYERGDNEPDVETWKLLWDLFRVTDPLKFWDQEYFDGTSLQIA
jgi:DNA-binding XRE family transcriptional regulator